MNATTSNRPIRPHGSRFGLVWLSVFTLLAVCALLFAFQRVVHAAVDKAQADRIQQSQQAQAQWQCNRLQQRLERRACVAAVMGAERLPDVVVTSRAD